MNTGLSQEKDQARGAVTNQPENLSNHSVGTGADTIRKKLREVLRAIETAPLFAAGEYEIQQVACDSRKVRPGAMFFALPGAKANGNEFIQDAIQRGAVVIASEQ